MQHSSSRPCSQELGMFLRLPNDNIKTCWNFITEDMKKVPSAARVYVPPSTKLPALYSSKLRIKQVTGVSIKAPTKATRYLPFRRSFAALRAICKRGTRLLLAQRTLTRRRGGWRLNARITTCRDKRR
eukprot:6186565-Pleurochrysis_carterae.AAC.6